MKITLFIFGALIVAGSRNWEEATVGVIAMISALLIN